MVIVTNGDSARAVISASGERAPVIAWRDVLHDGPVPRARPADLNRIRAHFLSTCGWADEAKVLTDLTERDAALLRAAERGEVVLWFEHDLYDQLQQLQAIALLADAGRIDAATIVACDRYIGWLQPSDVAGWLHRRRPVTEAEVEEAVLAWQAFTAPTPELLPHLALAPSTWPFLRPAFERLVQEFPDSRTGLPRTESSALTILGLKGPLTLDALFRAQQDTEAALFMGDASFARRVDELLSCACPPVTRVGDDGTLLELTSAGAAMRDGTMDHLVENGIDRWIGGTHLREDHLWRWDAERAAFVRDLHLRG